MPLYEYVCTACGHEFDEIQKFSDPAITKCPECAKKKVIKKISLSGFALKGEGWYKDGYSRPSDKVAADNKKSESKAGAKKESAPKPSSESKSKTPPSA